MVRNLDDYLMSGQASDLVATLMAGIFVLSFLVRHPTASVSSDVVAWLVAIVGTFSFTLLGPGDGVATGTSNVLMIVGGTISTLGCLSLGRSFGIVPANRGIRVCGLYRCVRHPMYAGYAIFFIGYLLGNLSMQNLLIGICSIIFFVMRAVFEEQFLQRDPAYKVYVQRVRWRFFPYVL